MTDAALVALLSATALLLGTPDLAAQSETAATPLQWAAAPSLLPPGALIAVVSGDPTGTGQSTIELSMPDGYRIPPHFHPTDERVEVKQGTLLIGETSSTPGRRCRWPLAILPSPRPEYITTPSQRERR
jgi:hypothetical protein